MAYGHDPKLSRADHIFRALEFTFQLGRAPDNEAAETDRPRPEAEPRTEHEFVRDARLAELLSRLADRWDTIPIRERAGLGTAIASVLDLAGAKSGAGLDRTVEFLGWRTVEDRKQSDPTPHRPT